MEKIRKISESVAMFPDIPGNFLNFDRKPNLKQHMLYSGYFKSNDIEIVQIALNLTVPGGSGSLL